MRKAGGIIAIIAGVLGLIAAAVTFMFGGLITLFSAPLGIGVIGMSALGALACFFLIIFGSIAINAHDASPGAFIIATSIIGGIFGGGFVAIVMVLAFIGGIFACISPETANEEVIDANPMSDRQRFRVVIIIAVIFLSGIFYLASTTKNSIEEGDSLANEDTSSKPISNELPDHSNEAPADIAPALPAEVAPSELQPNTEIQPLVDSDYARYESRPAVDFLNNEVINPIARKLLGDDYDEFMRSIVVSPKVDMATDKNFIFCSGCNAQKCVNKAGFIFNKTTNEAIAILIIGDSVKKFGPDSQNEAYEKFTQMLEVIHPNTTLM